MPKPKKTKDPFLIHADEDCNVEIRNDLLVRLNRIEGQVAGIKRMIEAQRDCEDVLTQIHAVRGAMEKVFLLVSGFHVVKQLTAQGKDPGQEGVVIQTLKQLLKL